MKGNLERCEFAGFSWTNTCKHVPFPLLYYFLQYACSWEKQYLYIFKNESFISYQWKEYVFVNWISNNSLNPSCGVGGGCMDR